MSERISVEERLPERHQPVFLFTDQFYHAHDGAPKVRITATGYLDELSIEEGEIGSALVTCHPDTESDNNEQDNSSNTSCWLIFCEIGAHLGCTSQYRDIGYFTHWSPAPIDQ